MFSQELASLTCQRPKLTKKDDSFARKNESHNRKHVRAGPNRKRYPRGLASNQIKQRRYVEGRRDYSKPQDVEN